MKTRNSSYRQHNADNTEEELLATYPELKAKKTRCKKQALGIFAIIVILSAMSGDILFGSLFAVIVAALFYVFRWNSLVGKVDNAFAKRNNHDEHQPHNFEYGTMSLDLKYMNRPGNPNNPNRHFK